MNAEIDEVYTEHNRCAPREAHMNIPGWFLECNGCHAIEHFGAVSLVRAESDAVKAGWAKYVIRDSLVRLGKIEPEPGPARFEHHCPACVAKGKEGYRGLLLQVRA